jgi:hypothetical protein
LKINHLRPKKNEFKACIAFALLQTFFERDRLFTWNMENQADFEHLVHELESNLNDNLRLATDLATIIQLLSESGSERELAVASFVQVNGILITLKVMRLHPSDLILQCVCCGILALGALSSEENQIAQLGGIPLIIGAMRRSFTHQAHHPPLLIPLQTAGCGALAGLTTEEENHALIVEQKGIEAIVAAINAYQGDATLKWTGCKALYNMAKTDTNRGVMGQAGSIQALVSVLEYRPELDNDGRYEALGTLSLLVSNNENLALMAKMGCTKTAIAAMTWYSADDYMPIAGCEIFAGLALDSQGKKDVIKSGGPFVILSCMRDNQGDARIQEVALRALANLSKEDRNVVELVNRLRGIDEMVAARDACRNDYGVQQEFCNAFYHLIQTCADQLNELPAESLKRDRSNSEGESDGCLETKKARTDS